MHARCLCGLFGIVAASVPFAALAAPDLDASAISSGARLGMQDVHLSGEIGYSPWAAGILLVTPANSSTQVHGGTGSVFDFSLGIEWL